MFYGFIKKKSIKIKLFVNIIHLLIVPNQTDFQLFDGI